jgi:CheY-like chemotaxis protein
MKGAAQMEAKATILIVDDVPKNIQVLGHVLDREGYLIAAATNGRQALGMIDKVKPDLVLMDIMMPEMDGFEACRRIKEIPALKEIPIILLTAKTETDDIVRGFEMGAVDYLTKPFNPRELAVRVQTHIELKRARDTQKKLVIKLKTALKQVKQLSGLLPICSYCKKIRDDQGAWQQLEVYISEHSEAQMSHGICDDCLREHYPDIAVEQLNE